jgi:PPOX class probable F420-dependent enzyme
MDHPGPMSETRPATRPSVRLTPDEAWGRLEAAHTGIFVTLRRDGIPIALPMWFVVLDRRLYVRTPARSKKVARIRRDPRVSFLIEAGERWAELTAVHVTGRAEVVDDAVARDAVEAALDRKYAAFRTARAEMPSATRAHYAVPFVTIRIVPDARLVSWDNRKLGLP